jgi:hypothetical protein
MKPSEKQLTIMLYLHDKGLVSKKQMMEDLRVEYWYYHNAAKHFGDILSRMVNSGFIQREKKGYFKLVLSNRVTKSDEKQLNLF